MEKDKLPVVELSLSLQVNVLENRRELLEAVDREQSLDREHRFLDLMSQFNR